ncbi:MAG: serine hydrolase [Acidimicrobiia bacterium]|nr:serine hydrolase [Acidimicrobiia bacterium]
MSAIVSGTAHPDFAAVEVEFARNFAERGEVGASLHVTVEGETVVDLWGGHVAGRPESGEAAPWLADTLVVVFSSTKGWVALCAHLLVARGELDLEAPVAEYWPGFAKAGKAAVTVRMMLDHSAGVPTWREKLPAGAAYDWELMVARLEEEEPFWEPGTRNGYHMLSFGWTVGELVRRVSGRSLGTFLREELAGPLGADVWIGLPEAEEGRVSNMIPFVPDPVSPSAFTEAIRADRRGLQSLALMNQGGFNPNRREGRAAEIGGGGGMASGRGMARLYGPFANGGGGLVDPDTLARMGDVAVATESDAVLLLPTRFALGFMKSMDNRRRASGDRYSAILGREAFGHVGAGGSLGFADPACRMSFGYAMNRHGEGILLNDRGQSLVDATYRCLGYRSDASGAWTR